jgi:hypothetical protein
LLRVSTRRRHQTHGCRKQNRQSTPRRSCPPDHGTRRFTG